MITSGTRISARQFVCCIGMCMGRSGCDVWRLPRHTRAVDRGGTRARSQLIIKGGANAKWAGTWQAQRDVVPATPPRLHPGVRVYVSMYNVVYTTMFLVLVRTPWGGGRGVVRIRHVRSVHDRPARQPRRRTAPAGNAR